MAIDKINNAPTRNEQIDKINEIIDGKQDTLVSGVNIKTINNESILGSGNVNFAIQVDQHYNAQSTNPQSGTAVAEAVANGSGIFWATYNSTTYQELVSAYADNMVIMCVDNSQVQITGEIYYYLLVGRTTMAFFFQLVETNPTTYSVATSQIICKLRTAGGSSYDWSRSIQQLEKSTNKVTSISSSSTDTQYPSAKCVYDALQNAGGNASRNIGEVVESTIPLTDAGLHLLDGSLLQRGIYGAFVDYIASIYGNYIEYYGWYDSIHSMHVVTTSGTPSVGDIMYTWNSGTQEYVDTGNRVASVSGNTISSGGSYIYTRNTAYDTVNGIFCSESDWQTSVTTYGVCGKFVYNSSNNTVRLPKITGFTEGTIDATNLGDLTEAGLPDHRHSRTWKRTNKSGTDTKTVISYSENSAGSAVYYSDYASANNAIYGNSNTVQPQSIKVLYYIVVANSAKTEIEVDIDEIATDLNGKVDVDLSNTVSSNCKNIDGPFVPITINTISLSTSVGSYSHDLSSILPNDSYTYLVECTLSISSSNDTRVYVGTTQSPFTNNTYCGAIRSTSSCRQPWNTFTIPVYSDRMVYSQIVNAASSSSIGLTINGYRRMGTNN